MTGESKTTKKPPFFPKKKEIENVVEEKKEEIDVSNKPESKKEEIDGPKVEEKPMKTTKKESSPAGTKKYKFMFQTPGDKPMTISFKDGTSIKIKYGDIINLTPEQYKRFDYWFKEIKE